MSVNLDVYALRKLHLITYTERQKLWNSLRYNSSFQCKAIQGFFDSSWQFLSQYLSKALILYMKLIGNDKLFAYNTIYHVYELNGDSEMCHRNLHAVCSLSESSGSTVQSRHFQGQCPTEHDQDGNILCLLVL